MKESRDILTLFEQLNSHEVFTPPRVARDMLALLPKDIWCDPSIRILDPCVKSGVFLREALYLLIDGLAGKGKHVGHDGIEYDLNDGQQRMNHILKNMLFGIATSELTGYISRRTLYGVMEANTDKQTALIDAFEKSKSHKKWTEEEKVRFLVRNHFNEYYDHGLFNTPDYAGFEHEGNIFYPAAEVNKKVDDSDAFIIEDTYYPFIEEQVNHGKIQQIKDGQMKFDVVIGNPPYQINDGGGVGSSAVPIYHKFILSAKELKPKFVSMIVPSRWMAGGRGLDQFRDDMLKDKRIRVLHDIVSSKDCFPGVDIKGGVCYFLWERNYSGNCEVVTHENGNKEVMTRPLLEDGVSTFLRHHKAISIFRKVKSLNEPTFSEMVSSNDPFGFDVREKGSYKRVKPDFCSASGGTIPIYFNGWRQAEKRHIPMDSVRKNHEWLGKRKIFIPKAWGNGDPKSDVLTPLIVDGDACCTETYLVVGPFDDAVTQISVESYIKTKFFHFMVSMIKNTQNTMKKAYEMVPCQDFSQSINDDYLFEKYSLSKDEIQFIENLIPDKVRG